MPTEFSTMADLLRDIGDVAPSRVRMQPLPGTATIQDVINAEVHENRLCELVDGVLVEKAMGFKESVLAIYLIRMLESFVRSANLGIVTAPDGMMEISAGLVRIPDVAFVSWARLPGGKIPDQPIPGLVPDFAVEILSPSNTPAEMSRKRSEYFAAGVQLVWEADPDARTVSAYTQPAAVRVFRGNEILTAAPVLPGFQISVAEWFAELDRRQS